MRRFSVPSRGVLDLLPLLLVLNGFLFWFSDVVQQNSELAGLDFLLWLIIPTLFIIVYLTLGRIWPSAGLMPKFQGQALWLLFAITLPPALAGLLLLVNHLLGLVTIHPELMRQGTLVGLLSLSGLFVKNIVEEFIFRGFLAGRFAQTVGAGLPGHIMTGVIWAFWHLAYWTVMLPEGKIAEVSGIPLPAFVVVGFIALSLQSILLGELRLVTGSIWAGVLLHTMNNAIFAGLVAAQAVPRGDLFAALFTPIDIGIVYTGLMGLIGVAIWQWRLRPNGPYSKHGKLQSHAG